MSAMHKLTPWFRNGELPVRAGLYQTKAHSKTAGNTFWRFFDGVQWHCWSRTRAGAMREPVRGEPDEWRGLAEDPSKAGGA